MNWKDEIDKRHKGQSGFFKEIEQPKSRKQNIIDMKTIKKRLTEGEKIKFESETDMMIIWFGNGFGSQKHWWIELNCKIIHSPKTFDSFEKKLNSLIEEGTLIES